MNDSSIPTGTGDPALATAIPVSERFVVGLAARASNAAERAATLGVGPISRLWASFMQRDLLDEIPNQVLPGEIVAVYTEYDSDHDGEYLAVLGRAVSSLASIPDGMIGLTIPAQTMVSIAVGGDLPATIPATWERALAMFAADSRHNRTFIADLDIYPVEQFGAGPSATILIGIHPPD